jgi:hypothetical protein
VNPPRLHRPKDSSARIEHLKKTTRPGPAPLVGFEVTPEGSPGLTSGHGRRTGPAEHHSEQDRLWT